LSVLVVVAIISSVSWAKETPARKHSATARHIAATKERLMISSPLVNGQHPDGHHYKKKSVYVNLILAVSILFSYYYQ